MSCPGNAEILNKPSLETGSRPTPEYEQRCPEGITLSDFVGTEDLDLGRTTSIKHNIPTADDTPVTQRHRRIPPNQLEEVKQHLQQLLHKGVISPSQSDYSSPVVLVRKKKGALCVDYRQLNSKVKRYAYPLPRIEESLDVLGGARYFSTIDLALKST